MKCKCGSSKLRAYNPENLDYILYYVNNRWVLSDPSIKSYFNSQKPFYIDCMSCWNYSKHDKLESIPEMISPSLDQYKEITLDLDHTLFHIDDQKDEKHEADFTFKFEAYEGYFITYYAHKRPYVDQFIQTLCEKFEKINIFTAAQPAYADVLVKSLNIPQNKMGYLKNITSTQLERGLEFERQYLKPMENSLVVEDKPLVIKGYNNTVIKVRDYFYVLKEKDQELLRVLKLLSQKEKIIKAPNKMNGEISLLVRSHVIKIKDMPYEKYKELLKIKTKTKDELNKQHIIYQESPPSFCYKNNKGEFTFTDLSYDNYVRLFNLIKKYTKNNLLSEKEYNQLLTDRIAKHKKQMNF